MNFKIIPNLPPDQNDKQYTVTMPKELVPYLEQFFYPQKKREGETIEQYLSRSLVNYGRQVMQEEFRKLRTEQIQSQRITDMVTIEQEVDELTSQFI